MMTEPLITVLAHAKVPSPESAEEIDPSLVVGIGLHDALTRVWSTDAHLTAYEPVALPALDDEGNETGDTIPVRLTRSAIGEGIAPRMVAMIGDVDPPGHVATPEWRAEVEPRLDASGLAWYSTRNGYRVIATIADPIVLTSVADEMQWWDIMLGWREYLLATHGIEIDPACKDWTRIMRLPNVRRDGKAERSDVRNLDAMPAWDFGQWLQPAAGDTKRAPTTTRTDDGAPADARTARAQHLAAHLPASIAGMGGDEALFVAANEVATQLGEDPAAIEGVLSDTFNPRCDPPWPAAKLRYEATRAAERQATPEARHMRRADERRMPLDGNAVTVTGPEGEGLGDALSFLSPDVPIEYLCEGLRLTKGDGKISLVAGQPGSAKGPVADHLALCFALGLPAFGAYPCAQARVLVLDYEGARLTMRRVRRMARGVGHDPTELEGRIRIIDARKYGSPIDPGVRDRIKAEVDRYGIGVVIADSYTSAMQSAGIEANSPEYAQLATQLGCLDVLVLCVAHSTKQSAQRVGELVLSDIAYSMALASMAQTVIGLHYPDPTDKDLVHVNCARAPEESFPSFRVRFAGALDCPELRVTLADRAQADVPRSKVVAEHRAQIETASRHADRIEALLREVDKGGAGMTTRKIGRSLGLTNWTRLGDAMTECRRRGSIEGESLPCDKDTLWRLTEKPAVQS